VNGILPGPLPGGYRHARDQGPAEAGEYEEENTGGDAREAIAAIEIAAGVT
jgi:hypothetical protein